MAKIEYLDEEGLKELIRLIQESCKCGGGAGTTETEPGPEEITYEYDNPVVSLGYADQLPSEVGGTINPTITVTQVRRGSDGSEETLRLSAGEYEAAYSTEGLENAELDGTSGMITCTAENGSAEMIQIGTVSVEVVANGKTGTATSAVYQSGAGEVTYEYDNPNVTAEYDDLPNKVGEKVSPRLVVSQVRRGSDGSVNALYLEDGEYEKSFNANDTGGLVNAELNEETGVITCTAENVEEERLFIGLVNVNVTANGKSGSAKINIYQKAAEETEPVVTYGEPVVTLRYPNDVPADGGTSSAVAGFTQKRYVDGTEDGEYTQSDGEYTAVYEMSEALEGVTINSANGEIGYSGVNDGERRRLCVVTLTVTARLQTGVASCEVYQLADSTVVTYGEPEVTLEYPNDIPAEGGATGPSLKFTQKKYVDGVEDGELTQADTDYTAVYSIFISNGATVNADYGTVTYEVENDTGERRKVCEVNVEVTANGMTGTARGEAYQAANEGGGTEPVVTYGEPEVTLEYHHDVPSEGGTSSATAGFTQKRYVDGVEDGEYTQSDGGYTAVYSMTEAIDGAEINSSNGAVTYGEENEGDRRRVCVASLSVTARGETGSKSCDVYQSAKDGGDDEPDTGDSLMDVLLWNKDTRMRHYVSKDDWSIDKYPADTYEPLGVVVVPASHGRYGDTTTIGVMALRNASADSGEAKDGTWTDNDKLAYGNYSEGGSNNYEGIRTAALADIPYNLKDNVIYGEYQGYVTDYSQQVYFPSDDYADNNSRMENTLDTGTYYAAGSMAYGAPSPYENGSASVMYGESGGGARCFGRFDGRDVSLDYMFRLFRSGEYEDWLNDGEVPQGSADTSSEQWTRVLPAMEACWRFSPIGSCEGGWHLPSAGEIGYMMARKRAINNTIDALDEAYHPDDTRRYAPVSDGYLSSTEFTGDARDRAVVFDNTAVTTAKNWSDMLARPFKTITGVTGYGEVGYEDIPSPRGGMSSSDENMDCPDPRWCLYREYSAQESYEPSYPSGKIAKGDVYGALVSGRDDLTVLKTGVKLFSISDVAVDAYDDEIETCKNYGYYNSGIEPGWYVVERVECTDGDGKSYTIDNIKPGSLSVGAKLADGDWNGLASVCYRYPYMGGVSQDGYGDAPYNTGLSAFRAGYWNHNTVVFLHGAEHDDDYDKVIPGEYEQADPETFRIQDLAYGDGSAWLSADETNVVKTVAGGRLRVSAGSTVILSWGACADNTFVTLTKGSSKFDGESYANIETRLALRLCSAMTGGPYKTVVLGEQEALVGDGTEGGSRSLTYIEYFTNGSATSASATVDDDCYVEPVLIVESVSLGAGARVEINGESVSFYVA